MLDLAGPIAAAVSVVSTLGAFVLVTLLWRMRGEFATKTEVTVVTHQIAKVESRVTIIETERAHAATREDVGRLGTEVSELRGDIKAHDAKIDSLHQRFEDMMERIGPAVSRIETYLLDRAGRD